MKLNNLFPSKKWLLSGAISALSVLALPVWAGLQVPYVPDANTLHLWHFSETSGNTLADSVGGITLTNIGLPTTPPYTNTVVGAPAYPGLGTCVTAATKQHLLYGGAFTSVAQFSNPTSDAFTFEALIRLDVNPSGTQDAEIVSGDNGLGIANRGWQWRIINGVIEWDLLAGGTDNDYKATLPTTGVDAAVVSNWYHIAVTYTGDTPTNGDTPNVMKFYWTLMDSNRVVADVLMTTNTTRPLSGGAEGVSMPSLGIGGSARISSGASVGNGEGLIGGVDEVRISSIARGPSDMAFMVGGSVSAPSITQQPATNTLSGYAQTLTVAALGSGSPPLAYQWLQNGSAVAGQTATTLIVSNATFAQNGNYQLLITNAYGSVTSAVAVVTIGAVPTGLLPTGLDSTGAVSTGDIVDPNWSLVNSADPQNPGPRLFIFENSNPIQFASPNGNFSPADGISQWVGAQGNLNGTAPTSPAGTYAFRSTFLIDQADPTTVTLKGTAWVSSSVTDVLINGKSTGTTLAPGVGLYAATFALTNGFVAGLNTVDFVETPTGAGVTALRVEISGVGQALPAGLPVINTQPQSQSVRDANLDGGSQATLSVVATGRPPLLYQWSADGTPITGATNRILVISNPTLGGQGTNFTVSIQNGTGTVFSQPAKLTVVESNQPPVPASISFVTYSSSAFTLTLSRIVLSAKDYDGDTISFVSADSSSSNAMGNNNIVNSGTALLYTPVAGVIGPDSFNYLITDSIDQSAGVVRILALLPPTSQVLTAGGSATFNVGLSNTVPAGFTFQWQFNGTNISAATNSSLTINNVQLANSGNYVLVTTDGSGTAWNSPITALTVGVAGAGTGLTGDYFASVTNGATNFTGPPTLTRLDPTVNFNWSTTSPDPLIPQTYFMVRWHGQVLPFYSEPYTFSITSDDGSRLWVNGQLVANEWQAQAATTASGQITLTAGQKYDIVMEYFQQTSTAQAQLSWSSAHQGLSIIPSSQLFPSATFAPTLQTSISASNLVLNWAGTFELQSATSVTGPWNNVSDIVSPYTVPLNQSQMYFRLMQHETNP